MMEGGFHLHHAAAALPEKKPGLKDVKQEFTQEECEIVEGSLPDWLSGTLFRQSGGAFIDDSDTAFLDGLAHVSAFKIKGGAVKFSNKYMRTENFQKFIKQGERPWGGTNMAPSSNESMLSRVLERIGFGGGGPPVKFRGANPNVNIFLLGKDTKTRVAAATESDGKLCEFDAETLSTIGGVATMPVNKGMIVTHAAHWMLENNGGYHVGLQMHWKIAGLQPKFTFKYTLWFGLEPPFKKVYELDLAQFKYSERAAQSIENRPSYMHSLARTKSHVVVLNSSKRMIFQKLLGMNFSDGFFGLFESVDAPLEFIIFKITDQSSGKVNFVDRIACPDGHRYMPWHLSNSFEDEDGKLVIHATVSEIELKRENQETSVFGDRDGAMQASERHAILSFTIDLEQRDVSISPIMKEDKKEFEFPNTNPKWLMRPYQHMYALENAFTPGSRVVHKKIDEEGFRTLEGLYANEIPSEPIFVAKPGSTDESEGVLLVEALDTDANCSHLLVCENTEDHFSVICRVKSPMPGNLGLHSMFVDGNSFNTAKY